MSAWTCAAARVAQTRFSIVARADGRVYAAVVSAGREARGRRAVDLLIAATAVAAQLPLYTRNPDDFAGLADLVRVEVVGVID